MLYESDNVTVRQLQDAQRAGDDALAGQLEGELLRQVRRKIAHIEVQCADLPAQAKQQKRGSLHKAYKAALDNWKRARQLVIEARDVKDAIRQEIERKRGK